MIRFRTLAAATFMTLSTLSVAHAQKMCREVLKETVTATAAARTQLRPFAIPVFIPGNGVNGPTINALVRYGNAISKGSEFKYKNETFIIKDWGKAEDGQGYVRLQTKNGDLKDLAFSEFPRGAFGIREIRLDDVMKYKNELVVERMLRDHPTMNRETAERAFDEMKNWFFVKFRSQIENHQYPPYMYDEIDTVDYAWHAFLLFTNHYADFGKKYFATFLHHKTQSAMDQESGVIRAVENKGPVEAEVNREKVVGFMRETLGEATYNSWFVRKDFDPHTEEGINKKRPPATRTATVRVGDRIILETPVYLTTRMEIFAKSYPVADKNGLARTDMPLYHVRKNRHYDQWLAKARAENPNIEIADYPLDTEVNKHTKSFLNALNFKESKKDPTFGQIFETIPSPELFEYRRSIWNATHGPKQQVVTTFSRKPKGDGQADMAKMIREKNDIGIGILDPRLDNKGPVKPADLTDPNQQMNNDPLNFKPELETVVGTNKKVLTDTSNLLVHDLGQWVNTLWLNKDTADVLAKHSDFYIRLREIVGKNGRDVVVPLVPEVRPDLKLGSKLPNGQYTAYRLVLDALHDSQRGVHSFTHMLSWFIRKPEGFVPGKDTFNSWGPTVAAEFRTHLQGMGVKPVGSTTASPSKEANFTRTWALAQPSDKPFTMMDGLQRIVNYDMVRAQIVAEALSGKVPGVAELLQEYRANGAFTPVAAPTLQAWAKDMNERYMTMGKEPK
ncbi:MAG: hypothetical protein EOP06_07720 [Proteobacteria bacterium]|nr:MAG: hypothetical protein EOP06_07720 [Pseudomonadota bacterium]